MNLKSDRSRQSWTRGFLPPRGSLAKPPAPHPPTATPAPLAVPIAAVGPVCHCLSLCRMCLWGKGRRSLPSCLLWPFLQPGLQRLLAVVQGAPGCRTGSKALVHPSWAWVVCNHQGHLCCPCCSGKAGVEGRTQTDLDSGVAERGRGTGPSLTPGQGHHLGPRMGLRWGRAGFAPRDLSSDLAV